jgi:lipopolysaccharide exporter
VAEGSQKKVLVGGSWLIAARTLDRLVGIISISILARLLTPADFGLVGIANTIVAAIELLTAFGFDWALVRLREPTAQDLNSAWTLRAIFGALTFLLLSMLGPVAATFYRQPALIGILVAMGLISAVSSLENIGTVYFRRDFEFHKEFLIRSLGKLVGFCVTVLIALLYRSYWALVVGVLAVRVATVTASYLMHPYRPRLSLASARQLFGFSSWVLFGNMIEYCREKFGDLYIGRAFGTATNGLFAVAGEISIVPITEVASPINRAAYSKYAEDVRASRGLGPSYVSIASLIWAIALPMAAGTIAVAPEAVALLLGPQWHDARVVLRWLALGTLFTVLTTNTHYVYWALGQSRTVALLGAIGIAVLVPTTITLSHIFGYIGAALAFAAASAVIVPVNFIFLRRLAGIRFRDLWRRVWRIVLATAVMCAVLWELFPDSPTFDPKSALFGFACKAVVGAITYTATVALAWFFCRMPEGPEQQVANLLRRFVVRVSDGRNRFLAKRT